jgi:ferrous-iron efflux pump FieF
MVQRRAISRTQSTAIRADSLHYATDLLTNVTVIIALVVSQYGLNWADSVMAIAVAAYIFYSAGRIGFDAVQHLMDRELAPEIQQQILHIARSKPEVRGVHDLRTRQSGQMKFVQLHVELNGELPLARAHSIADQIEREVEALLPDAEVIIHQDPAEAVEHVGRKLWPPASRDRSDQE